MKNVLRDYNEFVEIPLHVKTEMIRQMKVTQCSANDIFLNTNMRSNQVNMYILVEGQIIQTNHEADVMLIKHIKHKYTH